MTAKQKAKNIINKIMDHTPVDYPLNCTGEDANKIALEDMYVCKKIALSLIEEIIDNREHSNDYWNNVKKEIEKL